MAAMRGSADSASRNVALRRRVRAARAWKHLVPGGEARALAIHQHAKHAVVHGGAPAIGRGRRGIGHDGIEGGRLAVPRVGITGEERGALEQEIGARRSGGGVPEQGGALEQLARDVLPGLHLGHQPLAPRCERVDPRLDRVLRAAGAAADGERRGPLVVPERHHRDFLPPRGRVERRGRRGRRTPRRDVRRCGTTGTPRARRGRPHEWLP